MTTKRGQKRISVFNQVEDFPEYNELERYPYTPKQTTNITYMIITRTRKYQDAIKTWNGMNPIQQNWINSRTHFCTAHHELEETGELTMKVAGYHQPYLVNNTTTHMYGLLFIYPPQ